MTMTNVDLRDEAAAEVQRLTEARAILRAGDARVPSHLDGTAPWIAISRRHRLRRAVGRRVCLVWRVAIEDASGRIVESRIVPVLVDIPASSGRASIRPTLERMDSEVRRRIESGSEPWRAEATRIWIAFTTARRERERDLAERRELPAAAAQAGLFDRRSERMRTADAATMAEAERSTRERMRAIDAMGDIASAPTRLLLILVP
jgi:hypothetical protein